MVQYKWLVLANTTTATLMSSIDSSIVTISIQTIGKQLPNTSVIDLLWILLGYQLVNTCLVVNFGRLSDIFGRVKLYNLGFAIFTVGSALCSLAQSGPELVGFRVVQGIGAAFISTNSGALVIDTFPMGERGKALGIQAVAQVLGSISGLSLGGLLTQYVGWRSIFWVNIPIGLFATAWSHYKLKELGKLERKQKVDLAGNVTFASGIALLISSISFFALGYTDLVTFALMVGTGLALIAVFGVIESRVASPMFKLGIFKIRYFTIGSVAASIMATARGAMLLTLSIYLQGPTMRLGPGASAIYLIPVSICLAVWGPLSGTISDRYGALLPATIGLGVSSLGFLLLAQIGPTITFTGLLIPLVMAGSGFGFFASANRSSVLSSVPPTARGVAVGMNTTMVSIGSTLSQGLAFLVMSFELPLPQIQAVLVGGGSVLQGPLAEGFLTSIHITYYISATVLVIAIIPSLLRGKSPQQVNREPKKEPGEEKKQPGS